MQTDNPNTDKKVDEDLGDAHESLSQAEYVTRETL